MAPQSPTGNNKSPLWTIGSFYVIASMFFWTYVHVSSDGKSNHNTEQTMLWDSSDHSAWGSVPISIHSDVTRANNNGEEIGSSRRRILSFEGLSFILFYSWFLLFTFVLENANTSFTFFKLNTYVYTDTDGQDENSIISVACGSRMILGGKSSIFSFKSEDGKQRVHMTTCGDSTTADTSVTAFFSSIK
jgi:hypothetical protein